MVLRNVLEEKTNRIVEIITSSVKPIQLMIGKIVGVAFIGLTQLLIWIVSLVILLGVVQVSFPTVFSNDNTNIAVTENLPDDYYQYKPANSQIAEIQDSNIMDNEFVAALANINFTQLILMFLFFFITGYFLLLLYAAIGGAVETMPTHSNLCFYPYPNVAFIVSQYMLKIKWFHCFWFLSFINFLLPCLFALVRHRSRTKRNNSIVHNVNRLYGCCLDSCKIYRTGILMYGKNHLQDLWKWIKYNQ